jgi:hypothetical protein
MCQRFTVRQIIDRNHLNIAPFKHHAKRYSADPAKSVYRYSDFFHDGIFFVKILENEFRCSAKRVKY